MRLAALILCAQVLPAFAQDLHGHGGPVSALAARQGVVVSGGFDGRAILWNAAEGAALRVERFHDGNVTAVAVLPGGFATAGQDGRIALWKEGQAGPIWATAPGTTGVSALAAGPEGIAAGFLDGRIARIDPVSGALESYPAHAGRVSGLAFLGDGALVSVGADLRFVRWGAADHVQARVGLPELPNGLVRAGDVLAVPFADGSLRLLSRDGALLPERFLTDRPLVAVAATTDTVAAAAVDGMVWLLDAQGLERRAQVAGGTGPVWALALDGDALFAAGAMGLIRRFSAIDGTSLGATTIPGNALPTEDSRGAQVWQACAVCHSLDPGDHSRAGPSLHGLFNRRIASIEDYGFSASLRALDIVWTRQTLSDLFELGPEVYTPGSRMPDQRLTNPADRAALAEFLERFSP